MATFYIQLSDKLLKIGDDVTKETIHKALGYTPSSFSGNFNDLTDNPFAITDDGEFNIVDENGNIVAKFDDKGLHVIDVEVISEDGIHKLSNKVDKNYVDNLIFNANENLPFKEDESGSFDIADLNGNIITSIDSNGVSSVEFNARGHKLTEKIDNNILENRLDDLTTTNFSSGEYVDITLKQEKGRITNVKISDTKLSNAIKIDEDPAFQISDNKNNIAFKVDEKGAEAVEFRAGKHYLTNKTERTYVDNELLKLRVDTQKSIGNIKFSDLTENPFNDSEEGTLKIVDNKTNIIVTIDNNGVTSTEFIAGKHKLTEKSDLNYVNNNFLNINTSVGTLKDNIQNNEKNISSLSDDVETLTNEVSLNTSAITELQNIKYASSSSKGGAADSVANALTIKAGSSKNFSIDIFNGSSVTTIPLPTKISHLENDSNLTDDFNDEFHIIDNEGNKIATFNNYGLFVSKVTTVEPIISQDFIAGEHKLSNKVDKNHIGDSVKNVLLTTNDLTNEEKQTIRNNIGSVNSFEQYSSDGGILNEEQYRIMSKYLYTPFMISSNSVTTIPDELLNESKTNFFCDWCWNIMRITGGEPIVVVEWDDYDNPTKFKGLLNGVTYVVNRTNWTIAPEDYSGE